MKSFGDSPILMNEKDIEPFLRIDTDGFKHLHALLMKLSVQPLIPYVPNSIHAQVCGPLTQEDRFDSDPLDSPWPSSCDLSGEIDLSKII